MSDTLTVSSLNRLAKNILESNSPNMLSVEGEISNITYHVSGHLYFTIKDDRSSIKAVAFSYRSKNISSELKHGDNVKLFGRLTIYETTGQYQFLCSFIEENSGFGELYKKFLELKEKLSIKGYFDEERKRKIIPSLNIGVVTSEKGAVIRDIITTAKSRAKNVSITLYPALVQGNSAKEVIEGIEYFNNSDVDLIIIGRGGGSFEDLNLFNSEALAETIISSSKPIISAVGHETDFVISDFVADVRAATPTQAAVLAVLDVASFKEQLDNKFSFLNRHLNNFTKSYRQHVDNIRKNIKRDFERYISNMKDLLKSKRDSFILKNFPDSVKSNYIFLDESLRRLNLKILSNIDSKKINFAHKIEILKGLNPLNILSRGYSMTYVNGKNINSIKYVKKDDEIETKLNDGSLISKVISKQNHK